MLDNDKSSLVGFIVGCYQGKGVDLNQVHTELENLVSGCSNTILKKTMIFEDTDMIYYQSSKEVYECLFSTKLTLETRQHDDFANPKNSQSYEIWVQANPPIIPDSLQGKIEYVELDMPVFPC